MNPACPGPARPHRQRRLQFAHLEPTGLAGRNRGQWARFLDIKRHPESYILLCKWCHKVMDSKRLHDQFRRATTPVEATSMIA